MVVKRRGGIFDEYEIKQPPILCLQIWDDDLISRDDFLGSLELNLSNLPEPFETSKSCTTPEIANKKFGLPFREKYVERNSVNLFKKKKIKGWFPMRGPAPNKSLFQENPLAVNL